MQSHPNYTGYDAVSGKPGIRITSELAENLGRLTAKDLPTCARPEWLPKIEAVRQLAVHAGLRFAISPYEWQVAKIFGEGFTIVLWSSKLKGGKGRYMRVAFEGPDSPGVDGHTAWTKIAGLVK